MPYIPSQPALPGPIAHNQTLPVPAGHVPQTPSQVKLLLQLATAPTDSSELLRRMQVLAALVSHVIIKPVHVFASQLYLL